MTPTLNLNSTNVLSSLSIATIHDTGYEVTYSEAGNYDGSDTACCDGSTPSQEQAGKPELSPKLRAEAIAYGKQILKMNERPGEESAGNGEEGLTYVGEATVIVMENDHLYHVHVTSES